MINISNSNTAFSSFVLDSGFGFKVSVSVSLKFFIQKLPLVLSCTWNDYNGLVWRQEANPVANKIEYIREGYALRNSLKRLKYKKQKKENWMFCKVYKRIKRGLKNVQLQFFV